MATDTGLKFTLKGNANATIGQFAKQLENRLQLEKDNITDKLERVLDVIERISQDNIPKDTGAAKASFFREVVVEENGTIVARAGYNREGGADLDYLIYIHEIQFTNYTTPGTGPYFLSRAFQQASLQIESILGNTR